MAVAGDLSDRRGQRHRPGRRRQRRALILRDRPDELVRRPRALTGVGTGVTPRLNPLAAASAPLPDRDPPAALRDAVPELKPRPEPGYTGGGRMLAEDQQHVAPAVARKP